METMEMKKVRALLEQFRLFENLEAVYDHSTGKWEDEDVDVTEDFPFTWEGRHYRSLEPLYEEKNAPAVIRQAVCPDDPIWGWEEVTMYRLLLPGYILRVKDGEILGVKENNKTEFVYTEERYKENADIRRVRDYFEKLAAIDPENLEILEFDNRTYRMPFMPKNGMAYISWCDNDALEWEPITVYRAELSEYSYACMMEHGKPGDVIAVQLPDRQKRLWREKK